MCRFLELSQNEQMRKATEKMSKQKRDEIKQKGDGENETKRSFKVK